jgi:RimJ/RimL family protein N-acetyltransferase
MQTVALRQWKDSDFEPYAAMNADAEVMRYFLAPVSRSEAVEWFGRMREAIDDRGWGIWAVDVDGLFAGMVGLNIPRWPLPFMPCTEILWRFRREYWGRSVAFEAANQALAYGFTHVGLAEIVAFTTPPNFRSIRLMERLGFTRDAAEDFDHPAIPKGHPLRRHLLYRKKHNQVIVSGAARAQPKFEQRQER